MPRFPYLFPLLLFSLLPAFAKQKDGQDLPFRLHRIQKVVIDAGHGGKDSGSLGSKGKEKDITLKIALQLGRHIEENMPDVKVVYTRKTDDFLELGERADLANSHDADVFISIHCNSLPKRTNRIQGSETYVMGLHTAEENLAVAKRENEVILLEDNYMQRYGGYDPNSPEAHIILSMYQNAFLSQSIMLAEKVEEQFKQRTGRPSRGVKQAGFVVLRATAMPSILVETGFLSHSQDEAYLLSSRGQGHIASAIYRAFREYKRAMEQGDAPLSLQTPTQNTTPIPGPPKAKTQQSAGPVFRVQLAASPTKVDLNQGRWRKVSGVEIVQEGKMYRYLFGAYSRVQEAVEAQRSVRAQGFPDAFVVAYENGKRVDLEAAKKRQKR